MADNTEFSEIDVEPLDLPDDSVVKDHLTTEKTVVKETLTTETNIQAEQLAAYRKAFDGLQADLTAIDERHRNDARPDDSETVKELKSVRTELAALKEELAKAKQAQNMPFQPTFYQPTASYPFQQQVAPQSHFQPFYLPQYQIPVFQPSTFNANMGGAK